MKKFKISHEVPKCFLVNSLTFNSYQYCLPHLMETDENYRDFFLYCKQCGVEIYLDNSLHELGSSMSDEILLKWVRILEPSTFFIPDVWEDAAGSIVNARRWANIEVPKNTTKTAIVQAKNAAEAYACVKTYKDLGYKKIAFSYGNSFYNELVIHPNKDMGKALGRVSLISRLYYHNILTKNDRVHLLGTAIPQEFSWYDGIECIESLDTSNPIMAALDNMEYSVHGLNSKPKSNLNNSFNVGIEGETYNKILLNIVRFNNLIPDIKEPEKMEPVQQPTTPLEPDGFVSIYEATGVPAGKLLGGYIYTKAKESNIKTSFQNVDTKSYKGKIMLYPKSWLKENYDSLKKEFEDKTKDDLPF